MSFGKGENYFVAPIIGRIMNLGYKLSFEYISGGYIGGGWRCYIDRLGHSGILNQ